MEIFHQQIQKIKDKSKNQNHLKYSDKINLGAFYTPKEYVNIVWSFIKPFLNDDSVVLDSSCGYGNFFDTEVNCKKIGNDIDVIAISQAKKNFQELITFNKNALFNVNRDMFNISKNDKLIIIGNPPYNDITSIIRNQIKTNNFSIDADIKTRDYGLSFLLSYTKLEPEIICVLHPLSYLVKKTNFDLLRKFTYMYKLIDGIIFDSATFKETSKGISFPIIIALYKRESLGMQFNYIYNYRFKTIENKTFSLREFDFITNYINKYPSKGVNPKDNDIFFWTMRDINALKRNKTFVNDFNDNTIIIDKRRLDYYIYIDVFKQFSHYVPYYFGNLDVFINDESFQANKDYFIFECLTRHSFLNDYIKHNKSSTLKEANEKITNYFKTLLGEHFVHPTDK
ncbi:MAG: SAM-dependent methyltransferase [Candidatus Kapabacteria bacterium]|nr:SAM-dependent methyltransferase [Candidatus Kapabacteria bacterium]